MGSLLLHASLFIALALHFPAEPPSSALARLAAPPMRAWLDVQPADDAPPPPEARLDAIAMDSALGARPAPGLSPQRLHRSTASRKVQQKTAPFRQADGPERVQSLDGNLIEWPDFNAMGAGSFSAAFLFAADGSVAQLDIVSSSFGIEQLGRLVELARSSKSSGPGSISLRFLIEPEGAAAPEPDL